MRLIPESGSSEQQEDSNVKEWMNAAEIGSIA
jgi:hypothetical protein